MFKKSPLKPYTKPQTLVTLNPRPQTLSVRSLKAQTILTLSPKSPQKAALKGKSSFASTAELRTLLLSQALHVNPRNLGAQGVEEQGFRGLYRVQGLGIWDSSFEGSGRPKALGESRFHECLELKGWARCGVYGCRV